MESTQCSPLQDSVQCSQASVRSQCALAIIAVLIASPAFLLLHIADPKVILSAVYYKEGHFVLKHSGQHHSDQGTRTTWH